MRASEGKGHPGEHACACPAGRYGYLKAAAATAVSARGVLRHSYVAAYALQWGEPRRWGACFGSNAR